MFFLPLGLEINKIQKEELYVILWRRGRRRRRRKKRKISDIISFYATASSQTVKKQCFPTLFFTAMVDLLIVNITTFDVDVDVDVVFVNKS